MKINKLRLQTSNLKEQIRFYYTILGFKIIDKQSDYVRTDCYRAY
jgi:catechol-2,3-dioxygenase